MEVLEGQNILVTISGKKSKIRVYYLSWLRSKILKTDQGDQRSGFINVGDLEGSWVWSVADMNLFSWMVAGFHGLVT